MIKVLFMGRKQIAASTLEWLSGLNDVEIVGVLTDSHLQGSPTENVARRLGYKLYDFDSALAELKSGELTFDLGVSILYWRKLRDEFLSIPSAGVINFHPAPLPEYKGTGGYNFAIMDDCDSWGVTAHYVDENIDTGEIIEVYHVNIDKENETCASLEKKSMLKLEVLIRNILYRKIVKKEQFKTTPNTAGRYICREQMEEAKKIRPGDDVARKVRAFWFPPYDGAYIEIDGKRFTLISEEILMTLAPAGTTSLFANPSTKIR